MYSIEIRYKQKNTGNFIFKIEKGYLYESTRDKTPRFTREEAMDIIEYIKNYYVYSVMLRDEQGNEELISCITWDKPKAKPVTKITLGKKSSGLRLKFKL